MSSSGRTEEVALNRNHSGTRQTKRPYARELSEQKIQFQNLGSYYHEWQSQGEHSCTHGSSDGPEQVTLRPVQVTLLSDLKAAAQHLTSLNIEDIQLGTDYLVSF